MFPSLRLFHGSSGQIWHECLNRGGNIVEFPVAQARLVQFELEPQALAHGVDSNPVDVVGRFNGVKGCQSSAG